MLAMFEGGWEGNGRADGLVVRSRRGGDRDFVRFVGCGLRCVGGSRGVEGGREGEGKDKRGDKQES